VTRSPLSAALRWRAWARALAASHAMLRGGHPSATSLLRWHREPPARPGRPAPAWRGRVRHRLDLTLRLLAPGRAAGSRDAGTTAAAGPAAPASSHRRQPLVLRTSGAAADAQAPHRRGGAHAADALALDAPAHVCAAAHAGLRTARKVAETRRRDERLSHSHPAVQSSPPAVDPVTGWPMPVGPAARVVRAAPAHSGATEGAAPATSARPLPERAEEPLDIGRLADEVVQQIDRRIVAHRERTGRI